MRGFRTSSRIARDEHFETVNLWILRALVNAGFLNRYKEEDDYPREISSTYRLRKFAKKHEWNHEAVRAHIERLHAKAEASADKRKGTVFRNVDLLGDLLGMNAVERDVVAFCVLYKINRVLEEMADNAEAGTLVSIATFLSRVLDCPRQELQAALDRRGILISTRIIEVSISRRSMPVSVTDAFSKNMLFEYGSAEELMLRFFKPSPGPKLSVEDFPHLKQPVDTALKVLGAAMRDRTKGVNVLFHGPPGTGKTELCRALGKALDTPMYEVGNEDDDGDAMGSNQRANAYLVSQRILEKQGKAMVLFDEMEDLFKAESMGFFFLFGGRRSSGNGKAWTNQMLETNPVPTIWVTNHTWQVDPAYLRRFDLLIEIDTPPRSVRKNIVNGYFEGRALSEKLIDRIASDERLKPADIEKLARVHGLADDPSHHEEILTLQIEERLRVRGEGPRLSRDHVDVLPYDLGFLNADCDLQKLVESLMANPRGTVCLYGPPGTGKSALVHHLAKRLDRPLVARRASDIQSCWIGECEKNIASMFREAKGENALLFLDEADTFLQDRRGAHRSWEVSQVNEMLTQMELFDGLFVCATNLMESLDQASLRRFAIKVRFDYLDQGQRHRLFDETSSRLGLEKPGDTTAISKKLDSLSNLTPGDFATVVRRWRMIKTEGTTWDLLVEVEKESKVKQEGKSGRIGF